MVRGILLTANLPQLQNLIKRDPKSYKEEFLQQWNHYNSIRQIFHMSPDEQAQHFRELVAFISQVCAMKLPLIHMPRHFEIGCAVLPEGDRRVPFASVNPPPGELWHTLAGHSQDAGAEPRHVA
jgi:hypothetical protein